MKKLIMAVALVAAMVIPAASASAKTTLQLSGPSVTLANLFGNSGGGITFGGQQIEGIQPAGTARYREEDPGGDGVQAAQGDENELRLTAKDVNAPADSPVGGILIDLGKLGQPPAGAITQLNGQSLQFEIKSQDGDTVPDLTSCGSVILAIPFQGLDFIAASLTQTGDVAQLFAPPNPCG